MEIDDWGGAHATGNTKPSPESTVKKAPTIEPKDPNKKGTKRLRTEQSEAETENMEIDGGESMQQRSSSGGNNAASRETPVLYREPELGFRETHTALIPTTFYFSVNKVGVASTDLNKVEIRMNSPYLPFMTTLVPQATGVARVEGVSSDKALPQQGNEASLRTFPSTVTANHKPMWLKWWEQIYDADTDDKPKKKKAVQPAGNTQSVFKGSTMPKDRLEERLVELEGMTLADITDWMETEATALPAALRLSCRI